MNELPQPLVPADVNLRGLPWMPVDTVRLLDSDTWALSTGDQFKAAFKLWCKAWQQVPAASLPDDDKILANLSGTGRMWPKFKTVALRGFVKCSDGRLYHPVIADKALEAWARREEFIEKTDNRTTRQQRWRARVKQLGEQIRALGVVPPAGASLETLERLLRDATRDAAASTSVGAGDARETALRETETGIGIETGTRQDRKATAETTLSVAPRRPGNGTGASVPAWQAYSGAYQQRYSVEPVRNAKVNGMLARFVERVPHEEAPLIAAFYVLHSRQDYVRSKHCVDLLLRDAEGLRTEWATGRKVTDTDARQADRTAANVDHVNQLLDEARAAGRRIA